MCYFIEAFHVRLGKVESLGTSRMSHLVGEQPNTLHGMSYGDFGKHTQ